WPNASSRFPDRWQTAPRQLREAFGERSESVRESSRNPSGFVRGFFGKTPHFFEVSSGVVRENPLFLRELFGKRSGNTPISSGNVRLPPKPGGRIPEQCREPAAGSAKA